MEMMLILAYVLVIGLLIVGSALSQMKAESLSDTCFSTKDTEKFYRFKDLSLVLGALAVLMIFIGTFWRGH